MNDNTVKKSFNFSDSMCNDLKEIKSLLLKNGIDYNNTEILEFALNCSIYTLLGKDDYQNLKSIFNCSLL